MLSKSFHDLGLAHQLDICRRGTEFFAACLASLSDEELNHNSRLEGWTRSHVVAHAGYNGAALCRLLDWAATGSETPMYASREQRNLEIEEGARKSATELRNLFAETAACLDAKWSALPSEAWNAKVRTAQGRTVAAVESVWMRTREVWVHAVDLDNGAQFSQFPNPVLETLLTEVITKWEAQGVDGNPCLEVIDTFLVSVGEQAIHPTVHGTLPDVVMWATGRARADTTGWPTPPVWL